MDDKQFGRFMVGAVFFVIAMMFLVHNGSYKRGFRDGQRQADTRPRITMWKCFDGKTWDVCKAKIELLPDAK